LFACFSCLSDDSDDDDFEDPRDLAPLPNGEISFRDIWPFKDYYEIVEDGTAKGRPILLGGDGYSYTKKVGIT